MRWRLTTLLRRLNQIPASCRYPIPRLNKLAEIYKTDKIVPATVTFVDIAGLVAGASQGEGLGNQFLSHIRSTMPFAKWCGRLTTPTSSGPVRPDPKHDIEIINTELDFGRSTDRQ